MKSRIEGVAELSMKLGGRHLADHGSIKSRHDCTQRQLMSCLVLKTCLKATYRSIIDLLEGHAGLRRELGLKDKVPHHTALQKFNVRQDVQAVCEAMIAQIGQASPRAQEAKAEASSLERAIDSTGPDPTAPARTTSAAPEGKRAAMWSSR